MSPNGSNQLPQHSGSLAFAPLCLLMTGCVTSSVSAAGTRFHYAWWLPLGLFMAGLVFIPIGLALTKQSARFGWGLMIAGPIAALAFAPSLFLEQVTVTDKVIDVRSGIWGMTANQTIDFDSVKTLRIAQEATGGRNSRLIEVLYFDMKNGSNAKFALNNDVKIEAGKHIVRTMLTRDIPVVGAR